MITEVVAALLIKDGRFLICQRPETKKRAFLWEFVGGKVEQNETKEDALKRECLEELDMEISVLGDYTEVTYAYSDLTVHLTVFLAEMKSGTYKLLEHRDAKWITPDEIGNYVFCDADKSILEKIKKDFKTERKEY